MSVVERARLIRQEMEEEAVQWSDEKALELPEFYPQWKYPEEYKAQESRVRDLDVLYKCIQSHTSQADWQPHLTPALWKIVSIEEWPDWIQPHGSEDSYSFGDKVSHLSKHWISDYDNNVWEPGVFGWSEA